MPAEGHLLQITVNPTCVRPETRSVLRRQALRSAVVTAIALCVASAPPRLEAQVAVITNPHSPVSDLSLDELRRVFSGKTTQLAGGTTVTVAFAAGAQDKFCEKVFESSVAAIRKRWAQLAFQGEVPMMPPTITDGESAKKFLATSNGAIAFLPLADVDASVKIIKIDGASPRDAAYKIK